MGGAQRNARKQKQSSASAARAVAAARGKNSSRNTMIIGIVVVALVAAAVLVGVIWTNNQNAAVVSTDIPKVEPAVTYPSVRDGVSVVSGKDSAKVTIDAYEDFICPGCGGFEKAFSKEIEEKLEAGKIKVRYTVLPMLDRMSKPTGYSSDASNAGLCAADAGKFTSFHASLFAKQPKEGGRGYTKEQLIKLGKDLGAGGDFEQCVQQDKYGQQTKANMETVTADPNLQQTTENGTGFSTPTVAVNKKIVNYREDGWLDKLVQQAG